MFKRIKYHELKAKQQENYNFHKVASILAEYGFNSIKLNDDWQGADFLAYHVSGNDTLKIQLKGRLVLDKKYIGKDIYIAFRTEDECYYLYPHDEVMDAILEKNKINETESWRDRGMYSWPHPPSWILQILENYKI